MTRRVLTVVLIVACLCGEGLCSEHGSQSDQGIFSGSFADAGYTIIAFLVLLAVLGRIAWKPVLRGLKNREDYIRQQIESAEVSYRKAQKMLEEHKEEGVRVIKGASEQARRLEETIIERTQQEVMLLKRRAQEEIEQSRAAATEQLWEQAGEIVLILGKEVLSRSVTEEDDKRLISDAITRLKQK